MHRARVRARRELLRHRERVRARARRRSRRPHDQGIPARVDRARDEGVLPDGTTARTTAASRASTCASRSTRRCAGCKSTTSISISATATTSRRRSKKPSQMMNDLVRAGKILYWGVSEWNADQIARRGEPLPRARLGGARVEPAAVQRAVAARRAARVPGVRAVRSGQRRVVAARDGNSHRQVHRRDQPAAGNARRRPLERHDGGLLHAAGARRGAAPEAARRARALHARAARARVVPARATSCRP